MYASADNYILTHARLGNKKRMIHTHMYKYILKKYQTPLNWVELGANSPLTPSRHPVFYTLLLAYIGIFFPTRHLFFFSRGSASSAWWN